jgi:hypothetical protein
MPKILAELAEAKRAMIRGHDAVTVRRNITPTLLCLLIVVVGLPFAIAIPLYFFGGPTSGLPVTTPTTDSASPRVTHVTIGEKKIAPSRPPTRRSSTPTNLPPIDKPSTMVPFATPHRSINPEPASTPPTNPATSPSNSPSAPPTTPVIPVNTGDVEPPLE